LKILISGHNGFVGKHLLRKLKYLKLSHEIDFLTKSDFQSLSNLVNKISSDDIIFHLAGVNRDVNEEEVYKKNNEINELLYSALEDIQFKGKLLFTSSTQEESETLYGKAKKNARLKFIEQSSSLNYLFYGIITPNIFGPFCKPNYNSFISTFSYMIVNAEIPKVDNDKKVSLIYIGDFIEEIIKIIDSKNAIEISSTLIYEFNVSEILHRLNTFNNLYIQKGQMPKVNSHFDLCLFNTFRSYIDFKNFFPKKHEEFKDDRGLFSELIRSFSEGQTSYSITKKGEIRGNHFHSRKIERFSVIKGKAKIQLREVLSEEKIEFILDGKTPSYVDMPIWYTHNIENIGDEDLITIFWINEHYAEDSSDTYLENV
jgi:UDP-2-acetamido-2,6-beta-L-arabino-hexul-4-ose reductase